MGLLRSEGAQLSMKDKAGDTPLLYAAKAGQLDAVEMVLNVCADTVSWWCAHCQATYTSAITCPLGHKMTAASFIPKENAKALHAANRLGTTPGMAAAAASAPVVLAALIRHSTFASAAGGMAATDTYDRERGRESWREGGREGGRESE